MGSDLVSRIMTGNERERESLFAINKEQRYKNILNITTVAGYQKGIPIKLVAYSTNNIRSMHNIGGNRQTLGAENRKARDQKVVFTVWCVFYF